MPEGLWVKCPACAQIIYNKDLAASLQRLPEVRAITSGSARPSGCACCSTATWTEHDAGLRSTDPLKFTDTKPYRDAARGEHRGDRPEGRGHLRRPGTLDGIETVVAAMEYGFIGGSMGVVVGEKITRAHRARPRPAAAGRSSSRAPAARA